MPTVARGGLRQAKCVPGALKTMPEEGPEADFWLATRRGELSPYFSCGPKSLALAREAIIRYRVRRRRKPRYFKRAAFLFLLLRVEAVDRKCQAARHYFPFVGWRQVASVDRLCLHRQGRLFN